MPSPEERFAPPPLAYQGRHIANTATRGQYVYMEK